MLKTSLLVLFVYAFWGNKLIASSSDLSEIKIDNGPAYIYSEKRYADRDPFPFPESFSICGPDKMITNGAKFTVEHTLKLDFQIPIHLYVHADLKLMMVKIQKKLKKVIFILFLVVKGIITSNNLPENICSHLKFYIFFSPYSIFFFSFLHSIRTTETFHFLIIYISFYFISFFLLIEILHFHFQAQSHIFSSRKGFSSPHHYFTI